MQIDWWTFALQTVNFLVLVWLLQRFLYKPVREVIEKRRALTVDAIAEAEEKSQQTELVRQELEEQKKALAQERHNMARSIRDEIAGERLKISEQARSEAEDLLKTARVTIVAERADALREVKSEVAELAVELAANLLRESMPSPSIHWICEQLDRHLEQMPVFEKENLQRELTDKEAHLSVVTASPLNAVEQEQWSTQLNKRLIQTGQTRFSVDPDVLGGAELRLPHSIIKLTWADQLEKTMEALAFENTP